MTPPNPWRGERVITAMTGDGPVTAILAATHDGLSRALAAAGVRSLADLIGAVLTLDPAVLAKVAGCFEVVDGDPAAVIAAAPGANGLDVIADSLVGLIKGQTEEEQRSEKERYAAWGQAQQGALLQAALEPMLDRIAEMAAGRMMTSGSPAPSDGDPATTGTRPRASSA
jgi:hypothetical protein